MRHSQDHSTPSSSSVLDAGKFKVFCSFQGEDKQLCLQSELAEQPLDE